MNDLKRQASSSLRRAISAGQGRRVLVGALVAALFAAVGLLHASSRIAVVREGYVLSRAEARHRELLRENRNLQMERATLKSAPRLESLARTRLGMAPPTAGQLIALGARQLPAGAQAAGESGAAFTVDRTVAGVTRAEKTAIR